MRDKVGQLFLTSFSLSVNYCAIMVFRLILFLAQPLPLANVEFGKEIGKMKKLLASLVLTALLVIALPSFSNAQIGRRNNVRRTTTNRNIGNRPSFYRRHRNLINIGIGTGGGALLGALFGGKKGAAIGALAGAGGSALYTYKIKPKKRRY